MTEATFLVDPFVPMALVGALLGLLFRSKRLPIRGDALRYLWARRVLLAFLVVFFFAAEIPCYFDWIAQPSWSSTTSCNEFMWDGYVTWPLRGIGLGPDIPSYGSVWTAGWLVAAFAFQCFTGWLSLSLTFQGAFFRKGNAEAWSKPRRD